MILDKKILTGLILIFGIQTVVGNPDIDECVAAAKPCSGHGKCVNTLPGYTCLCDYGYLKNETDPYNVSCNDIDECDSPTHSCKNGTCSNTAGTWTCVCPNVGFRRNELSKDVIICEDIDECSDSSYFCGGKCNYSFGSWDCDCAGGYWRKLNSNSNVTCEDIDECTENNIDCSRHGNCSNYQGGYTCLCADGFIFNETTKSCEDIDECYLPQYTCVGGKCSNIDGSWSCCCPDFGYRRHVFSHDVIVCEDIDECSDSSYYCGGTCNNTFGNWTCECDSGYTREPDKARHASVITCEDINECDLQSACIDGVCQNLDGSWTCICIDGKEPKTVNSSTIICAGGYQYIATLGITITASIGNKDPEVRVYLETQIESAYETKFPEQNVRVEIISISSGSDSRKKRQTSENLQVEFVLHFDEPVMSENITSAWHDYRKQYCSKGLCNRNPKKNGVSVDLPFNVVFEDNVEFDEDQQTQGLCNIQTHNHCKTDSTKCQYVNGTLYCECNKGYTRKTDYECTVSRDACKKRPCQNGGSCHIINENTDNIDFECICRDGWTGKTCEDVKERILKSPETDYKTGVIATGSSLGGLVIILAVIVLVVCRWKAAKVKKAEKVLKKNLDSNFKSFDGSLKDTQCINEGDSMTYDRISLNSYRLSNASLPYTPLQHNGGSIPQTLSTPNIYDTISNLANDDAHFDSSENRRYPGKEPKRFASYNQEMESNYDTDWKSQRNNVTGQRSPSPDYGMPSSPQSEYNRMENPNRSNNSGVGNGYSSGSNEYRRPDKRREYDYGNRKSTQF